MTTKQKLSALLVAAQKHPIAETNVLDELIAVLNEKSSTQECKILALDTLSAYAMNKNNVANVTDCLQKLSRGFEMYFGRVEKNDRRDPHSADGLHRALLTLLFVLCDHRFQGAQLLEVSNGFVDSALSGLCAIFNTKNHPTQPLPLTCDQLPTGWSKDDDLMLQPRLVQCGAQAFCDFSFPDTYFNQDQVTGEKEISKLTNKFVQQMGRVVECILQQPLLEQISDVVATWLKLLKDCADKKQPHEELLKHCDATIRSVLLFLSNALTYTHERSNKLRKHIAMTSGLVEKVVVPYIELLLDLISSTPANDHSRTLVYLLKTLTFVTFKINFFRPMFREANFTPRLLTICCAGTSEGGCSVVEILAAVVRFNINIDYFADKLTAAELKEKITATIKTTHDKLTPKEKERLARRLNHPTEAMYPVDTTSQSYQHLKYVFEQAEPQQDVKVSETSTQESGKRRRGRGNRKKIQQTVQHSALQVYGGRKYRAGKDRRRAYNGPKSVQRQRIRMKKRWVQLKGADPQEAATVPPPATTTTEDKTETGNTTTDGETITKALLKQQQDPSSPKSQPQQKEDLANDDDPEGSSSEEEDEDEGSDQDEAKILSPQECEVPPAYLCSLTKQLLVDPVISPYGDVFEREVIMDHLSESTRCPITNQELYEHDLVPDSVLKEEISRWKFEGFFRRDVD
eukprot:TRINITY_DN59293_c0_g1_i1.p1 TRINITY_DN59293_c0_g1~~TRINITY_DN59293_c0_g1_i1.p1  ORF type:complete len:696 (-),score=49.93 TRINITY_DN59293_c0_g1_i1:1163-3220(-)